ncbi:MAG: hypothetical protein IT366_12365 [Candidatus Hydrogenedentes bacterium]|nr:hypothetical protein [Candidatus Hydrogenedentota bacterium]
MGTKSLFWMGVLAMTIYSLAVFGSSALAGPKDQARGTCSQKEYVDENGDGVCDHFVDADNDGVCDVKHARQGHRRGAEGKGQGQGRCTGSARCPNFVDANNDGVNDNFIDENSDGVCDNKGKGGQCKGQCPNYVDANNDGVNDNFIDENNDGVCDNKGQRGQGQCQGNQRGAGLGLGKNFIDEDGDGKCDNPQAGNRWGGQRRGACKN